MGEPEKACTAHHAALFDRWMQALLRKMDERADCFQDEVCGSYAVFALVNAAGWSRELLERSGGCWSDQVGTRG